MQRTTNATHHKQTQRNNCEEGLTGASEEETAEDRSMQTIKLLRQTEERKSLLLQAEELLRRASSGTVPPSPTPTPTTHENNNNTNNNNNNNTENNTKENTTNNNNGTQQHPVFQQQHSSGSFNGYLPAHGPAAPAQATEVAEPMHYIKEQRDSGNVQVYSFSFCLFSPCSLLSPFPSPSPFLLLLLLPTHPSLLHHQ